jgi:hypothetical protein
MPKPDGARRRDRRRRAGPETTPSREVLRPIEADGDVRRLLPERGKRRAPGALTGQQRPSSRMRPGTLTPRQSLSAVHRDIAERCRAADLPVPSPRRGGIASGSGPGLARVPAHRPADNDFRDRYLQPRRARISVSLEEASPPYGRDLPRSRLFAQGGLARAARPERGALAGLRTTGDPWSRIRGRR